MLGAGFFHEMTAGRRTGKLKTYDQTTLMAEDQEEMEPDQTAFSAETMDDDEEAMVVALAQEGDEDASLVADFEAAASELLQNDDELAAAYNAYADARRRLNDKVRNRGFWPIGQKGRGKGFNKGVKGKFNKGHSSSRKSLQQRILVKVPIVWEDGSLEGRMSQQRGLRHRKPCSSSTHHIRASDGNSDR